MADWFAMGGYAGFVWPAYLLAVVVLAGNIVSPLRRFQRLRKALLEQPYDQETT